MSLLHFLYRLVALFMTETVHAQRLNNAIDDVGGNLLTNFTGGIYSGSLQGIAGKVVVMVWAIMIPVGIFLIVRAGFSLIISQDEGKLSTAKRTIAGTLIGIMLVFISQELVKAFVSQGIGGPLSGGGGGAAAQTLQKMLYGLVDWVLVMMAALGVLMIVVSVIRAIASFGKEEGVTNLRQTIAGTATGILMISLAPVIKLTLGVADLQPLGEGGSANPDATRIIVEATTIVAQFLLYLTLIAVVVVIYAGIRMIVTLGNDDEYKKSKELIVRALLGLAIVLLSYIAVVFVLNLAGGGTVTVS